MGLTVAVTGPTGEIGISAVTALEADPGVDRVLGMARREFDPAAHGWTKTEYRQGDILDTDAVQALVSEADVVVHLAFLVLGSRKEGQRVNLQGTRNVFEATVAAQRPTRIVYTSSVAAYGYYADNPVPLTEDTPVRGSSEHYYSEQKAEVEAAVADIVDGTDLAVYILRPCIVAGPKATALADVMPWNWFPGVVRKAAGAVPGLKMPIPDPGTPVQLVHHDDVAAAIALCATTDAPPGAYNIAGTGTVSISDVASALGGRPVKVPSATVTVAAEVIKRLPRVPSDAEWIHIGKTSVVMDISKATDQLGWTPKYSSTETLEALAAGVGK
ncbi:nucleoside-diphosphate-sugar epimerase [Williamsia limnetica]|uniref:Nucleoside-diphosphate-sugar epimerase n=1 Tax=Williamsia limnetica TaxID=882452 RepID=A0A318S2K1_WILLI|nr:NAD-dependent epimerase/dehydratase family protein [Williamsia limnetica]PYE17618.1 nucleoside-diphosphate-sugar epimerase [Williamsia limnetica]